MSKIVSYDGWLEARKAQLKKGRFYVNVAVVAALGVMIIVAAAAPTILNLQQRSIAQQQQQPQQQHQTAYVKYLDSADYSLFLEYFQKDLLQKR
jgi:hypothetical protein